MRIVVSACVLLAGVAFAGCGDSSPSTTTTRLTFDGNEGIGAHRLLDLGGLGLQASCQTFSADRYLTITAFSTVDGARRRSVLSGPALGGGGPRRFSSDDFGPDSDPYDVIGSTPGGVERGRFVFTRADGGVVRVTFESRSDRCRFDGLATYSS